MVAALEKQDKEALTRILGPEGVEILSSGDPVSDAGDRDEFPANSKAKHSLQADGERKTLIMGTNDWPFPIPLAKQGDKPENAKHVKVGKTIITYQERLLMPIEVMPPKQ